VNLGFLFYENKRYSEAVPLLRKAAERNNPIAQYWLGACLEEGNGVNQDQTEAVKWYRKAADQGDSSAQTRLGICYIRGIGLRENKPEAVKWFFKAADQEDKAALYWLGICYRFGLGVDIDINEAVKWYRKAADQGAEEAKEALEELGYYTDLSVVKQRLNERKPMIEALKKDGTVGESKFGFLGFTLLKTADLECIRIVSEENRDRRAIYADIAEKNGSTVEKVGELQSKQIRSNAKSGEYIQDDEGKWIKVP
jgi:TPR repeat protein